MWYIYTMEYYSAIKSNEIMPFAAIWMDLESVIWSEVSQTEEKYHMTSLIEVGPLVECIVCVIPCLQIRHSINHQLIVLAEPLWQER